MVDICCRNFPRHRRLLNQQNGQFLNLLYVFRFVRRHLVSELNNEIPTVRMYYLAKGTGLEYKRMLSYVTKLSS